MALLNWTDSLSVQVTEIDDQHKKLVVMINELNDAMRQGKGKEALGKIVNGLIGYTAIHFKTEEDYFARFNYRETAAHQKEHAAFVKKVSDFKDQFEKGKTSLSIEVMGFLSEWLKNHIQGTDKKYTQCFNENGVK